MVINSFRQNLIPFALRLSLFAFHLTSYFYPMTTLISNIKLLVNTREEFHLLRGKELSNLPCIEDAFLIIEDDRIAEYGAMKDVKFRVADFTSYFEATGKMILPSWCEIGRAHV